MSFLYGVVVDDVRLQGGFLIERGFFRQLPRRDICQLMGKPLLPLLLVSATIPMNLSFVGVFWWCCVASLDYGVARSTGPVNPIFRDSFTISVTVIGVLKNQINPKG